MGWILKWPDNPFHYSSVPEMKFVNSDFNEVSSNHFKFDWSIADFVLVNSTCFEDDLMLKIFEKS